MKPMLLNKDGIGAAIGHLCDSDVIQVDNGGVIEKMKLTGNVVDTESYDVLILGKRNPDGTFEVSKMESLADENHPYEVFQEKIDNRIFEVISFHKSVIRDVEKIFGKEGKQTSDVTIETDQGLMHARTVREPFLETENGRYVLLLCVKEDQPTGIRTTETEIKKNNYVIKTVKAFYCGGIQLLA